MAARVAALASKLRTALEPAVHKASSTVVQQYETVMAKNAQYVVKDKEAADKLLKQYVFTQLARWVGAGGGGVLQTLCCCWQSHIEICADFPCCSAAAGSRRASPSAGRRRPPCGRSWRWCGNCRPQRCAARPSPRRSLSRGLAPSSDAAAVVCCKPGIEVEVLRSHCFTLLRS